ncbi:hypothetical protein Pmani_010950 [Petrolisthes manimaculis]|uniref:Major facilitator superfamily associated domain-containing protein n=1 Tax=Petrolisthes manimaculis TaxID=1843537 RepID=A0AAE1Q1M3_9EUCA|nr:hypothetical protein Pmani_010950 [Petrolisthes manimaculis]
MLMGLTVAVGGLAGVPILVAAESIITRLGHANTIVISTAFYVLRFVGYSFITSPWWCMPLETLECMTVALLMTTAVSYAAELATPATLATLQGVNGGVHYGVGRGLGSLLGGFLVEPLGVRNTFRLMAGVCAITCVLYFLTIQFLFPRLHGHSKDQTEITQSQRGKARQNTEGLIHRRDLEERQGQKTNMKGKVAQEKEVERRAKQESEVESSEGKDKEVERRAKQESEVESNEGGGDKEVEKSEEQEIGVESSEGEMIQMPENETSWMREVESGARDVELESGPGTTREVESGMEGLCSLEWSRRVLGHMSKLGRVKKIQSTYIRKCHITGGGPPPTPPKPDELTLLAESIMENDLQPAKEQLDTEDIDSGLQLLKDDGTFTGEDTVVIDIPEGDMEMLSFSPSGKVPMEQESLLLQDLSTIIAKEDHVESSSTLPSTSSSSPREKTANILEQETKKVSDKAVEFLDGTLQCVFRITDAVVKTLGAAESHYLKK